MANMINGRTPEEIKRWLRWATYDCKKKSEKCDVCEYKDDCGQYCGTDANGDILAYIEQLEAERDSLYESVKRMAMCKDCKSVDAPIMEEPCKSCKADQYCDKNNWAWKGVRVE